MHYKDGTQAKTGDLIIQELAIEKQTGTELIGILVSATAGSDTCNGQLKVLARRVRSDSGDTGWLPYDPGYDQCVTLKECLLLTVLVKSS